MRRKAGPDRSRVIFGCISLALSVVFVSLSGQKNATAAIPPPSQQVQFDIKGIAISWLQQYGRVGIIAFFVLSFLGLVISQAQNFEALLRLFGLIRPSSSQSNSRLSIQIPHNLPERKTNTDRFVGRDSLLAEIKKQLALENSHIYITGMGGVGKSELAVQHAFDCMKQYKGGIVWIDARQGLEGMRAEILSFFGSAFPNVELRPPEKLPENQLSKTLVSLCWNQWPASSNYPEPVLVILDDQTGCVQGYNDEDELFRGLPRRFRRITTQREPAPASKKTIRLTFLERNCSLKLLGLQAGQDGFLRIDEERKVADRVCSEVGDLPLALVLLGARLREIPDLQIYQLLQDLVARGAKAEALQIAHPELGVHRGVVEALLMSWGNLTEPSKKLALLLGILAPSIVPWRLVQFCEASGGNDILESSIHVYQGELIRQQLLERVSKNLYTVHPLVHQFFIMQGQLCPDLVSEWHRRVSRAIIVICMGISNDSLVIDGSWDIDSMASQISFLVDSLYGDFSDDDFYMIRTTLINGLLSSPTQRKAKIINFFVLSSILKKFKISLEGLILGGIELTGLDLSYIDFGHAYLINAKFTKCKFYKTNFSGTDLRGAYFNTCTLVGSIMKGANITGAGFPLCDLSGFDFSEVIMNKPLDSSSKFLIMTAEENQTFEEIIESLKSSILDTYVRLVSIGNPPGSNTMRIAHLVAIATILSMQDRDSIDRLKAEGILTL